MKKELEKNQLQIMRSSVSPGTATHALENWLMKASVETRGDFRDRDEPGDATKLVVESIVIGIRIEGFYIQITQDTSSLLFIIFTGSQK